jgi:hypothetical protein
MVELAAMHEAITKAAAEIENTAAIEVTAVGGFSVGGHEHDGRYEGQTYVQYVRQARPSSAFPLLLLHGGGLTGACFGDTPDGRPGWQWDFLRAGLDVLVADGAGYGRASYRPQPPVPSLLRDRQALWDLFPTPVSRPPRSTRSSSRWSRSAATTTSPRYAKPATTPS